MDTKTVNANYLINDKTQKSSKKENINFEEVLKETLDSSQSTEMSSGYKALIEIGVMALGKSTIKEWEEKGLVINEETIINAAKSFQKAFRELLKKRKEGLDGGISFNRHQIIINSQNVPNWFISEYKHNLSSIDEPNIKEAFQKGELYYLSLKKS